MSEHGIDPAVYRTSMNVSPEAHVKMQAVWQKHVTNSSLKLLTLSQFGNYSRCFKNAYRLAWETGCKGSYLYRDGSKSMQVLETGFSKNEDEDARRDPLIPESA
ncbi:MAG: hypothetical protein CM1200mP3_10900 [Chloroflexota bacterium]|nr:MAG: hypothetical protein CM1200mP3_10900 [Chloroflexota bacterium]